MMKAFKKGDVVSFETDKVSDWIERGRDGFQHEQSKSKGRRIGRCKQGRA